MAAYVVVQAKVTDAQRYEEYKKLASVALEKFGGKFLARGGAATDLEGSRVYPRLVIIEFANAGQAKMWYASPEYQKAKKAREGAGNAIFTVIDGV
jgi:uncharacterized protein (DUF1330 family)